MVSTSGRSSRISRPIVPSPAIMAPGILKEPMGWRFSSLRWIRAGGRRAPPVPASGSAVSSRGTRGVRRAAPAMRSRAWAISSGRGGSIARIALPSQLHRRAGARPARILVDETRRGHVLDAEAQRFEERDLLGRAPPGHLPEKDVPDLTHDVVVSDGALFPWDQKISRLVERRFPPVHIEPRARHRARVELAGSLQARADRVHVGPRRDPIPLKHRLA